jgi:putative aldouronate transport system permease protein
MSVNKNRGGLVRKKGLILFTMMLPGVIYLLFNNYLPMAGVIIAFKNINYAKGILGSPWVGLKNFEYLFRTTDAFVITRNTLLYNISFIIINLIVSVILALFLNEVANKTLTRFFQSVVLLPYLISMVIVGYLVFAILSAENGFVNNSILPALGMKEIMWYAEPKYWPVILTLVNMWKQAGYLCVIYYAAIIGLDKGLYEAAELDGAGWLQQIWHITLPQIKQVIVTMTLLQIGRIFYSDFGLFFQVTLDTGVLMPATNVIDTYVYRALMNLGNISMSSAAGLYQSLVGFALVLASNRLVRKIDAENALF